MVPGAKECDLTENCQDGSDESLCLLYGQERMTIYHRQISPSIVRFLGNGQYTIKTMPANFTCPDTHFLCPSNVDILCVPVYVRCNGVNDCYRGEDEQDCSGDTVTCPGYYMCRASSVCVHAAHLCDGWPQCPERDDELMCGQPCPSFCYCQGHAFICNRSFTAKQYPFLRYIDGSFSGIPPELFVDNHYLNYMKLPSCNITFFPNITLQNLLFLDLSENLIVTFDESVFNNLPNLKTLSLKGNPLSILKVNKEIPLMKLDISSTNIVDFSEISKLRNLVILNASDSKLGFKIIAPFLNGPYSKTVCYFAIFLFCI